MKGNSIGHAVHGKQTCTGRIRDVALKAVQAVVVALCVGACHDAAPTEVTVGANESLSASVGQKVVVRLQTIGPGEFASPPEFSGSAVRFDSVSSGAPPVPAGPTQLFYFTAVEHGTVTVTFHHTVQQSEVSNVLVIR